jgi:hypothetical protein
MLEIYFFSIFYRFPLNHFSVPLHHRPPLSDPDALAAVVGPVVSIERSSIGKKGDQQSSRRNT